MKLINPYTPYDEWKSLSKRPGLETDIEDAQTNLFKLETTIKQLAPEDLAMYSTSAAAPEYAESHQPLSPVESLGRLFRTMKSMKVTPQELVDKIDGDGDGELSVSELHDGLLQTLGLLMSDTEMADMMKALDKDGDGSVSMEELSTMLSTWSHLHNSNFLKRAEERTVRKRSIYQRFFQQRFRDNVLEDGVWVVHPTHGKGVMRSVLARAGRPYGVKFENGAEHAYTGQHAPAWPSACACTHD